MRKVFLILLCIAILLGILITKTRGQDAKKAFVVATPAQLLAAGIPKQLINESVGAALEVTLEEFPDRRWNASQGSYTAYVVNVLSGADTKARHSGRDRATFTRGTRIILLETIQGLREELKKRGLTLKLITLERTDWQNRDVKGDPNSDHKLGLAFDGAVTVSPCGADERDCVARRHVLENPLEQQLQILLAAEAVGVQQMNLYGHLKEAEGQSIHVGMSPFRNGAPGETLEGKSAEGVRRVGYGGPQRGSIAHLSASAAAYVNPQGISMKEVFDRMLHNPPPPQYRELYEAIRKGEIGSNDMKK